jgi:hypothetical protein
MRDRDASAKLGIVLNVVYHQAGATKRASLASSPSSCHARNSSSGAGALGMLAVPCVMQLLHDFTAGRHALDGYIQPHVEAAINDGRSVKPPRSLSSEQREWLQRERSQTHASIS